MTPERFVNEVNARLRAGDHAGILSIVQEHQRALEPALCADDIARVRDAIAWAAMAEALMEPVPATDDEIVVSAR